MAHEEYPAGTIGVLRIHHTRAFTKPLVFSDEELFLKELETCISMMGPFAVTAEVCDQDDLALRYKVYACVMNSADCLPAPEKLWRISQTTDKDILSKVDAIHRYEEAMAFEHPITVCTAEDGTSIREELLNAFGEEQLSAIIDAFFWTVPAAYRIR